MRVFNPTNSTTDTHPTLAGHSNARRLSVVVVLGLLAAIFAPYVPGTRLRFEVAAGYIAVVALLLTAKRASSFERRILLASVLLAAWTALRIVISPSGVLINDIILWTNSNFLLLGISIYLGLKKSLIDNWRTFVWGILIASVPINTISIFQLISPHDPVNQFIFANYGGTLNAIDLQARTDFTNNAEWLASVGRASGIFNGMHALAMFDIMILVICILENQCLCYDLTLQYVIICVGAFALVGGICAASKTFYGGTLIICVFLLLQKGNRKVYLPILAILFVLIFRFVISSGYLYNEGIVSITDAMGSYDISEMTALRYGAGSESVFEGTVLKLLENPLDIFIGTGGDTRDYFMADSMLMPTIIAFGMYFAFFYFRILLGVARELFHSRNVNPLCKCCFILHVFWLTAGLGIPTYQVGRLSPLLFILTFIAIELVNNEKNVCVSPSPFKSCEDTPVKLNEAVY